MDCVSCIEINTIQSIFSLLSNGPKWFSTLDRFFSPSRPSENILGVVRNGLFPFHSRSLSLSCAVSNYLSVHKSKLDRSMAASIIAPAHARAKGVRPPRSQEEETKKEEICMQVETN